MIVLLNIVLLVPNPLGLVAVLSAFNFPVAVYGWLARHLTLGHQLT